MPNNQNRKRPFKDGVAKKAEPKKAAPKKAAPKKAEPKKAAPKAAAPKKATGSHLKYMTADEKCLVCGDKASGIHYRAMTCEGCKGFFRRIAQKDEISPVVMICKKNKNCVITKATRTSCQACRWQKCLDAKMDPTYVKDEVGREELRAKKAKSKVCRLSPSETSHIDLLAVSYKSSDIEDLFWLPPGLLACGKMAVAPIPYFMEKGPAFMYIYNFVQNIPGIDEIDNDDLVTLIEHRAIDVVALQIARIYDPKENVLKFRNVTVQESDALLNEMLHRIFKYAKHYSQFCTEKGDVLGCLSAVCFLNPGNFAVKNQRKIDIALEYVLNITTKVCIKQTRSIRKLFGGLCDFENIRADGGKLLWKMSAMMEDAAPLENIGRSLCARLVASILLNIQEPPSSSFPHSASNATTVAQLDSDSTILCIPASNGDSAIQSASTSNNNSAAQSVCTDSDSAMPSASTSDIDSAIQSACTSHTASAVQSAQSSQSTSPDIFTSASCPSNLHNPTALHAVSDSNVAVVILENYGTYPVKMESGGEELSYKTDLINTYNHLAQFRTSSCTSGTMSQQPVGLPAKPIKSEYLTNHFSQLSALLSSPTYHSVVPEAPAVAVLPRAPGTLIKTRNDDHTNWPLDLSLRRADQTFRGSPAGESSNRSTSQQYPVNHPKHLMSWLDMERSPNRPAPEDDSEIIALTRSQLIHLVENLQSQNMRGFQGQASNDDHCIDEEEKVRRSNPHHVYLERPSQGSASSGLYSPEPTRLIAHPEIVRALSTKQLTYQYNHDISPRYHFNIPFANSFSEKPFSASPQMVQYINPPLSETFRPLGDQHTIQARYPVDAYSSPPGHASSNQSSFSVLPNYHYRPDDNRYNPSTPAQVHTSQQSTYPILQDDQNQASTGYSSLQDDQNHQASTGCYPDTSTVENATLTARVSAPFGSSVNQHKNQKGTRAGKITKASNRNVSAAAQMRNQHSVMGLKKKWLQNHLSEQKGNDAE